MMMKVKMDTEKGNEAIKNGRLPELVQGLLEKVHPESAYFGLEDGKRCGYVIFDMTDQAMMPVIGESLFMELGAQIALTPVMTGEDLAKGLSMM
jgi:hypothetical protein